MDSTKKRVQLDLDDVRFKKLRTLEKVTGSSTHSEVIRRLIDLAEYLNQKAQDGDKIDQHVLKSLFFTNLPNM